MNAGCSDHRRTDQAFAASGAPTSRTPRAVRRDEIRIVDEQMIPRPRGRPRRSGRGFTRPEPDAIVRCGFGFGMAMTNMIFRSAGLGFRPRFMSTAFEHGGSTILLWQAMLGMDRRRPVRRGDPVESASAGATRRGLTTTAPVLRPVVNFDIANVLLQAFADAHPLTPDEVHAALEHVKMIPATYGFTGHLPLVRDSLHRGWIVTATSSSHGDSTPTA